MKKKSKISKWSQVPVEVAFVMKAMKLRCKTYLGYLDNEIFTTQGTIVCGDCHMNKPWKLAQPESFSTPGSNSIGHRLPTCDKQFH